jgi:hypothetical protein
MITASFLKRASAIFFVAVAFLLTACTQKIIANFKLLTKDVKQFEKAEFDIDISADFKNPYDEREIALDMIITSPSQKMLTLPCYYVSGNGEKSFWKARFTPQEAGQYKYEFQLREKGKSTHSDANVFDAMASADDGFLHINDYWTFKFDSGKPFRGIGENIGWESRSFDDPKWTYDYLLPTLSNNGANFFRTWMCVWNLPVAWNNVNDTKRYANSNEYFNATGIKRMDELVNLCDSLGLYFMLSIDAHGAFIPTAEWKHNSHNKINGGPASTPGDFFSNDESKAKYKNRLRYLIARWGYSPSIGAWEFFNEIDNAVFTAKDSILIPHKIITQWHDEMSTYLKKNDPYKHIVTTSISHRDIDGMNVLANLDLNQKHIYNHTDRIAPTIKEYIERYKKPYVIGEFGYDWNWDNVKPEFGEAFDFDYKRGLWYGMFSPTPILPMTWWWEFFDDRKMTPYFKNVRFVNDEMMLAGKGSFESIAVETKALESYAVKCGAGYFVYVLNSGREQTKSPLQLTVVDDADYIVKTFKPGEALELKPSISLKSINGKIIINEVNLLPKEEVIFVFYSCELHN